MFRGKIHITGHHYRRKPPEISSGVFHCQLVCARLKMKVAGCLPAPLLCRQCAQFPRKVPAVHQHSQFSRGCLPEPIFAANPDPVHTLLRNMKTSPGRRDRNPGHLHSQKVSLPHLLHELCFGVKTSVLLKFQRIDPLRMHIFRPFHKKCRTVLCEEPARRPFIRLPDYFSYFAMLSCICLM